MKSRLAPLLTLTLLSLACAEDARFFRVAGPVASTITAFSADGYMTWTNVPAITTFTVQTAVTLAGPSNWVDYIRVPVTNTVTILRLYDPNQPAGMVLIPAGSFTIGSDEYPVSSEQPTHSVNVSAFYMDRYEVTKALWDEVYNWAITHGYSFDFGGQGKASNYPAHTMTWYEAVKWCNARSEKEGRTPAYYTSASQTVVYRSGQVTVDNSWVKWNGGYRLATEAEWEKAARGGTSGHRFPWGNTITHSQANYYSSTNFTYDISPTRGFHPTFNDAVFPYTSPAGYFAPNGYGLYDMAGNVWEWCWDWYGAYSSGSQTDPRGAASGSYRVNRGSSWDSNASSCRTAYRSLYNPSSRNSEIGFRSVLPSGQ